jgi:hypothetical protein
MGKIFSLFPTSPHKKTKTEFHLRSYIHFYQSQKCVFVLTFFVTSSQYRCLYPPLTYTGLYQNKTKYKQIVKIINDYKNCIPK